MRVLVRAVDGMIAASSRTHEREGGSDGDREDERTGWVLRALAEIGAILASLAMGSSAAAPSASSSTSGSSSSVGDASTSGGGPPVTVLEALLVHDAPTALANAVDHLTPSSSLGTNGGADRRSSSPALASASTSRARSRCLISILRARRNILLACADRTWGNPRGGQVVDCVVVSSGHEDEREVGVENGKGGAVDGLEPEMLRRLAEQAIEDVFEVSVCDTKVLLVWLSDVLRRTFPQSRRLQHLLRLLLDTTLDPAARLPIYQLLAALSQTEEKRLAVVDASQGEHVFRDRASTRGTAWQSASSSSSSELRRPLFPLIGHLVGVIRPTSQPSSLSARSAAASQPMAINPKLRQGALELLAALSRGQQDIACEAAGEFAQWQPQSVDEACETAARVLMDLVGPRVTALSVAAADCLANILKACSASVTPAVFSRLLGGLLHLLDQSTTDAAAILFIVAHLVADDTELQRRAGETRCLERVVGIVRDLRASESDEPPTDNRYRSWSQPAKAKLLEAAFLCLSSLALAHEPARAAVADAGLLPYVRSCLAHPSYGVRAAACQVARALSRSVAILRTSLVDSGIAGEVFALLKDEEVAAKGRGGAVSKLDAVSIAATATLCNLITEFSPMQTALIEDGGIELLVRLCDSRSKHVRTNALWALRNMLYKNELHVKRRVITLMTWPALARHVRDSDVEISEQALALLRNVACEGTEDEVDFVIQGMGEQTLLDLLEEKTRAVPDGAIPPTTAVNDDAECLEQALWVVYNVALGADAHRRAILDRADLLNNLRRATTHTSALVRTPALGAMLNILEGHGYERRSSIRRADAISRLAGSSGIGSFEALVGALCADPTFDVRDRAQRLRGHLDVK